MISVDREGTSPNDLRPGDRVSIFQMPLTREKYEGRAILQHCLEKEDSYGWSRWVVRFEGEDMLVERSVYRGRTP